MRTVALLLGLLVAMTTYGAGAAYAAGYIVYDTRRGVFGAAVDRPTATSAKERALAACRRHGGQVCSKALHIPRGQCGALAVQSTSKRTGKPLDAGWYKRCAARNKCWPGWAMYRASTLRAARGKTMRNCTKHGFKCKIVVAHCTK